MPYSNAIPQAKYNRLLKQLRIKNENANDDNKAAIDLLDQDSPQKYVKCKQESEDLQSTLDNVSAQYEKFIELSDKIIATLDEDDARYKISDWNESFRNFHIIDISDIKHMLLSDNVHVFQSHI